MPSYFAFFDLDETIINCKSLFSCYEAYCLSRYSFQEGREKYDELLKNIQNWQLSGVSREEINKKFYEKFSGISRSYLLSIIKQWFNQAKKEEKFFNDSVVSELKKHQRNGAHVVIVSGSFYDCVSVISNYLSADKALCINLEYKNDIYTGQIEGFQTIGAGKLKVIVNYMNELGASKQGSYGYGDHISDLPLLEYVENPIVVGNNAELKLCAHRNNWKTL